MKNFTAGDPAILFVDTWGWVVLGDRADPAHGQSRAHRSQYQTKGRIVTTDYVLDEVITLLFRKLPFDRAEEYFSAILRDSKSGAIQLESISQERFHVAWRLRLRYQDKPRISFTDLTSFVVMRELGITDVLTADAHFATVGLGFKLVP